jgi:tetraprenyl-beta-curcumene synthase
MFAPISKVLGDRGPVLRNSLALAVARVRFRVGVAQLVSGELERWESSARKIVDPALRRLALRKLQEEGFNAKAAAMLATLAPRRNRRGVARAIVALEVLYDYLDGRSETFFGTQRGPHPEPAPGDPIGDGLRAFGWLTRAVSSPAPVNPQASAAPEAPDGPYLAELSGAISDALGGLPATQRIRGVLQTAAARGAEAQVHAHASRRLGSEQLERWARSGAAGSGLEWREFLAGAAASVLAMHALISAAADPQLTREEAVAIDHAYMPVCALATLLDGVVDHAHDIASDEDSYIRTYASREELTRALVNVSGDAVRRAGPLKRSAGHVMTLTGVVAYYTTDPGADSEFARPAIAELQAQLGDLLAPAVVLMRRWRQAKRSGDASDTRAPAKADEPAPSH